MAQRRGSLNLIDAMHARFGGGGLGQDPGAVDPAALRAVDRWARLVLGEGRYFPIESSGWENLPPPPVMLVSNHSGGTSIPDAWGLGSAWYRQSGFERPIHVMAHDMVFSLKGLGRAFERVGVLRASREQARQVLGEWKRDLMVFPGGDLDTWRPFSARYDVRFSGRTGYARLAAELGVPIVPVAHVGAHHTLVVLTDGRGLARRLGLPALARATIFPVHLSIPWGLAVGPMPHLPPPTTLRYRVGAPLRAAGSGDLDADAHDLDAAVQTSIQTMLHALRDERRAARRG